MVRESVRKPKDFLKKPSVTCTTFSANIVCYEKN